MAREQQQCHPSWHSVSDFEEQGIHLTVYSKIAKRIFVGCSFISFLSLSCNTPATFEYLPFLQMTTLVIDIITGSILTLEAAMKLKHHGMLKGRKPYMRNRWLIFDAVMLAAIWISIVFQVLEMTRKIAGFTLPILIVRVPRALIMLRVFRYCLRFQFESGRLATILIRRAGQQIGGVTIFLLFFLLLYGLLGVQLFGDKQYHCVRSETNETNVSWDDLAIPDTYCSIYHHQLCPRNFKCLGIDLTTEQRGFSGCFDNIIFSIKTVYEAASQEGWVFMMYRSIDSYSQWSAYFYFVSLIFFLAWSVKNVFIAVIIETFAEIRVQLHNLWGAAHQTQFRTDTDPNRLSIFSYRFSHLMKMKLISENVAGNSWQLVDVEVRKKIGGLIKAGRFHLFMLIVILCNICVLTIQIGLGGSHSREGRGDHQPRWDVFEILELGFTIIFDIEVLIKMAWLGVQGYFHRNICKYEFFLATVTSINLLYHLPVFRSIPALRIVRLAKLSPTLESFVYKIFGPARKIGLLIAFTFSVLILMSTISLQLFCYLKRDDSHTSHIFDIFPRAFISMFQVMTQEGWIDVMQTAMNLDKNSFYRVAVAIYFILYHLFVTTVLISLFVAVILDNLELDECLKRAKQLKVNEHRGDNSQPLRLRIFEKFPNRPEMVRVSRLPGDFIVPKLRDTFVHQFVTDQHPHHDIHLHLHYQYHQLRRMNEMNAEQHKISTSKYQQLTNSLTNDHGVVDTSRINLAGVFSLCSNHYCYNMRSFNFQPINHAYNKLLTIRIKDTPAIQFYSTWFRRPTPSFRMRTSSKRRRLQMVFFQQTRSSLYRKKGGGGGTQQDDKVGSYTVLVDNVE